ncbi:MAG TPA: hypothetical protein PKM41_08885 [Deltaproteobacteria bacterium]|nr:hypothetical protein [Deltaproteobacteria bacterium]HOI07392.1 hypothetical protein [Deltaproteobacteria bacterium]
MVLHRATLYIPVVDSGSAMPFLPAFGAGCFISQLRGHPRVLERCTAVESAFGSPAVLR